VLQHLVVVVGAGEVVQTSTPTAQQITVALPAAVVPMQITQQLQLVLQELVEHHVKVAMVLQMVPVVAVVQEVQDYLALQVEPVELVCKVISMKPE
jgi:hypothetical protein